ncbi:MAG: YafY family transcriptional regulator [Lachnospiraceae bacterium]|nr:YafY family transcriptional regulator [Butyrivibrio sp.]MCM1409371.1 YafY family transcriptional regulator [Lachnospiraceae bacterium]
MKIDRLISIVVYLLNHGRTSAQKLAEEFEVSSRTIMRDLESLDQAGIPIQSFYGVEGGYQIMDRFVLEKQVATSHEYDWIVTALKGMVSAYAGKSLKQALEKVQSISYTRDTAVSVDLSVASEDDKINKQLMMLEDAIEKKCVVRFSYTNSHDEVKDVQVEPVCLQYKWYSWYLIGYYEKYQDYCMFKLVRMDNLQEADIKFTKYHNLLDIKKKDSNDNIVHVKLYGKAVIKAKCREYLNGRITQEFENGDFEFSFSVPEHETFWYGVILSFGNKAKIIEPQEIKERILNTCKEIQKEYEE